MPVVNKPTSMSVHSKQVDVHEDLLKLVERHHKHAYKRPIAAHTQAAFDDFIEWLDDWQGELIVDACCGVGESTARLAKQFPQAKVVGIDKSIARLDKHHSYRKQTHSEQSANYRLFQADLCDFWRLLSQYISLHQPLWVVTQQTLFYPNPYPKKSQVGKRWHASALLPDIIAVCKNIEVRSNWEIYIQEFLVAAKYYGLSGNISAFSKDDIANLQQDATTPFERKYLDDGQTCFKLVIRP